jgi:protein-S-isoprenylcysteine O-methyltransferase Ste14
VQISPLGKTVLGAYLVIVGLLMIVFHKQLKQMKDDWYENLPSIIWRGPTGSLLSVMIIMFGAVSMLVGLAMLLLAFVQQ